MDLSYSTRLIISFVIIHFLLRINKKQKLIYLVDCLYESEKLMVFLESVETGGLRTAELRWKTKLHTFVTFVM